MLTPVLILLGLVLVLAAAVALTRQPAEPEMFPADRDPYEQWAESTVDVDAWGPLPDRTRKDVVVGRPEAGEPAPAPTPTFTPTPMFTPTPTPAWEPLPAAPTAPAAAASGDDATSSDPGTPAPDEDAPAPTGDDAPGDAGREDPAPDPDRTAAPRTVPPSSRPAPAPQLPLPRTPPSAPAPRHPSTPGGRPGYPSPSRPPAESTPPGAAPRRVPAQRSPSARRPPCPRPTLVPHGRSSPAGPPPAPGGVSFHLAVATRSRCQPPPPWVVWEALVRPTLVVWSSIWAARPDDMIRNDGVGQPSVGSQVAAVRFRVEGPSGSSSGRLPRVTARSAIRQPRGVRTTVSW